MTTAKFNSKSPTIRRILKEAAELSNAPSPEYTAAPLESDLFEWHFTFRGPPNSAFANGIYHGRIVLPPTYPLRPPSFRFATPSGRFEVNREICLSISGHHEETWQPAWGVRTALVALRTFMETDPRGQLGGLDTSEAIRKGHAEASRSYKCTQCGKTNEAIIEECEGAAKACESTTSEVQVPSELKMGWKDELGESAAKNDSNHHGSNETRPAEGTGAGDEESAQLAEGFVRTATPPRTESTSVATRNGLAISAQVATPQISPAASTSRDHTAVRPAQTVATPTRTVSLPPAPNTRPFQVQGASDQGIPLWVDRSIVVIAILLAAMILRALMDT